VPRGLDTARHHVIVTPECKTTKRKAVAIADRRARTTEGSNRQSAGCWSEMIIIIAEAIAQPIAAMRAEIPSHGARRKKDGCQVYVGGRVCWRGCSTT
jgi:hypothetical protein